MSFYDRFNSGKTDTGVIAANKIAESNKKLGQDILNSVTKLVTSNEYISRAEIEARDRVDIALKDYLRMKNAIKELHDKVSRLQDILDKIKVPYDKNISKVDTYEDHDIVNRKHIYKIRLEIDEEEFIR